MNEKKMPYDPTAWGRLNPMHNFKLLPYRRVLARKMLALAPVTLLDCGCFNGWMSREMRRLGWDGEYLGIDVSDKSFPAQRAKKDRCVKGDFRQVLHPDGWDVVLCGNVLHHLDLPFATFPALFAAARRALVFSTEATSKQKSEERTEPPFYVWRISKHDVVAQIPDGWRLVNYERHPQSVRLVDQYVFYKGECKVDLHAVSRLGKK